MAAIRGYPWVMSSTVDELVAQLRDGGSRVTTARRLVLTALVKGAAHPTAEELLVAVRALAPDVHASTVYRNLEELERLGVVVHTHLGHGAATYHLATESHGHLVCEECGATLEAPEDLFEAMAEGAKRRLGFELRPYHFAVLGVCAACAAARDAAAASPTQRRTTAQQL
jgi:Fur family transcriptional regulator, ferric uptake regulator